MNVPEHSLPIVYVVNPAIAVTGAFVAMDHAAIALNDAMRVVLVLPKDTALRPEELTAYWRVDYLSMIGLSRNIFSLLRFLPTLVYDSWRLKKRMKNDGATRLILNDFYLMYGVVLRLLGYRGLIVQWVRCDPWRYAGPLARTLLWCVAQSANRVVVVSHYIQRLLPVTMRADIIHDYFHGQARISKFLAPSEEKRFVYVSNYIRGKGQDMAIEAFAIAAAMDESLALHFYGGDMGLQKNRDYRQGLEMLVQQKGLTGRVVFNGFVTDMWAVLATAYAALNFSESESFSMTVLEASGTGVPVIATQSGGPQEIIHEGVTGYLVPVGDVAAAADCMLQLARSPEVAFAMGQAASTHVHGRFSQQMFRGQLLAVLNLT